MISSTHRGAQALLRETNHLRVLDVLRKGPTTQAEIARATSLSGATVSTFVRELMSAEAIEEVDSPGRGQQLRLSLHAGVAAGIAFGNRRALVAVGDLTSTVRQVRQVPLPASVDAAAACALTLALLDDLLAELGLNRDALTNVGFGLPVPVRADGMVDDTTPYGRWTHTDLRVALGSELPCDVLIDNDANLGARAELRWGALQGRSVAAWVKASTGIGVGFVLGSGVHRGAKGMAGELGHVSVDNRGPVCQCGNRGCLELYAGTAALAHEYRSHTRAEVTGPELVERALGGDAVARRLVHDAGKRLGSVLAGLVTLVDPEVVVIGGDLAEAGDLLLDPLVAALHERSMPAVAHDVAVTVSALGDRAEVLGALALALETAVPRIPALGGSRR